MHSSCFNRSYSQVTGNNFTKLITKITTVKSTYVDRVVAIGRQGQINYGNFHETVTI